MRPGARGDAAGVRAHVAHAVVAGDLDELGIPTGPGVIDQAGAGCDGGLCHLAAPSIDGDEHVRVALVHLLDGRHHAVDFLRRVHGLAGASLHAANIDDRRTGRDHLITTAQRRVEVKGCALVIEGIRGAIDNRHHTREAQRGSLMRLSLMTWWRWMMWERASSGSSVSRKSSRSPSLI